MAIIGTIIHYILSILILVIFAQALMSFFMSPYDPVRQRLDRFLEPVYAPIRRHLPQTGPLDFTPTILIVILLVLDVIVTSIFR